jgi:hypothetical protein
LHVVNAGVRRNVESISVRTAGKVPDGDTNVGGGIILKLISERLPRYGLDFSDSEARLMKGCGEHGNKPSCAVKF